MSLLHLRRVPAFRGLTERQLRNIHRHVKEVSYSPSAFIFRESEPGEGIYIILEGKVRITKSSFKGKAKTLAVLHSGDFFGEMSTLDEKVRSASAETLTRVKALVVGRRAYQELISYKPAFLLDVLRVLVRRLRNANQLISEMEQRQEVHEKILEAVDAERKRISLDIHDGPAQALANITMRCSLIELMLTSKPEVAKSEIHELKNLSQTTLKTLRSLMLDLRPVILDAQGLEAAVKEYASKFQEEEGILLSLKVSPRFPRLPNTVEKAVFSVIQECLNNVKKHARAAKGWVEISFRKGILSLEVRDNGAGFDIQEVYKDYEQKGRLGLLGMRERAELIGGHFTCESERGKGTKISVTVPVQQGFNAKEGDVAH